MGNFHTNADGLTQHYGTRDVDEQAVTREVAGAGAVHELIVDFDYTDIGATAVSFWKEDSGGGATPDSPSGIHAAIPDGAFIKSATLLVKTAFVGATATLNIGTYEKDGTAIDADGIDATIAVTAIDANDDVVICDGAQVGAVLANGPAYIGMDYDTAAFTAGAARLVVEYIIERNA
jgi:hypothetical protein